eukprot:7406331-Pyramimonas_sp.AAC.1
MKAHSGSVFKLLVEHETQCKEQEVLVGGHLYNHFSGFLLQQWRVLSVPTGAPMTEPYGDPSIMFSFDVPSSYA